MCLIEASKSGEVPAVQRYVTQLNDPMVIISHLGILLISLIFLTNCIRPLIKIQSLSASSKELAVRVSARYREYLQGTEAKSLQNIN
jgi:hypothetical protein